MIAPVRSSREGPHPARWGLPSVTRYARVRDEAAPGPNAFCYAPRASLKLMGRGRVAAFTLPAAFSPT